MMEILRDPVWQFAGAIAATLTIFVPVAIYFAQRVRKDLTFEVVQNGRILTINEESVGKLQLVFDGKPVHDARLLEVRIANAGNQPITPGDFVRSLTLALNAEAIVLSAVVVETLPSNLTAEITFAGNTVEVMPVLLNPKDSFTIKLLASGYESGPILDARITGVSRVSEVREQRALELVLMGIGLSSSVAALWLVPKPPEPRVHLQETLPALLLMAMSIVCFILVVVKQLKRIKKRGRYPR